VLKQWRVKLLKQEGGLWREAAGTVEQHLEIQSLAEKMGQEMSDKHTREGQRDRCENQMSSPNYYQHPNQPSVYEGSHYCCCVEKNFGEDSEKQRPALMLFLPNDHNKEFHFLPIVLFIGNEFTS
jgi:hypothetical protein